MSISKLQTFVHNTLATYSLGAYRALVSGYKAASQVLVDPDWLGSPVRARTVESPILDIVPKVGTPMAVVCQDAAPSFPLAVGQIKEEGASEAMTAWVRADLNDAPNDIQVGGDGMTYLGTLADPDVPATGKSGVATKDGLNRALISTPGTGLQDTMDSAVAAAGTAPNNKLAIQAIANLVNAILADDSFSSSVTAST